MLHVMWKHLYGLNKFKRWDNLRCFDVFLTARTSFHPHHAASSSLAPWFRPRRHVEVCHWRRHYVWFRPGSLPPILPPSLRTRSRLLPFRERHDPSLPLCLSLARSLARLIACWLVLKSDGLARAPRSHRREEAQIHIRLRPARQPGAFHGPALQLRPRGRSWAVRDAHGGHRQRSWSSASATAGNGMLWILWRWRGWWRPRAVAETGDADALGGEISVGLQFQGSCPQGSTVGWGLQVHYQLLLMVGCMRIPLLNGVSMKPRGVCSLSILEFQTWVLYLYYLVLC